MTIRLIIFYFLITSLSANGQCEISQLEKQTQFGWGMMHGQSFTACNTGILDEIAFHTYDTHADGIATLKLYDGTGCNNLLWTVNNIQLTPNSEIVVNLIDGNGTDRTVLSGNKYSFTLTFEGDGNLVGSSGIDRYPYGSKLGHIYCQETTDNTDLYFSILIFPATHIEVKDKTNLINIYPNPANSILNFKPIDDKIYNISIHNIQGKIVYCNVGELKGIDITYLDKGMYFVKIANKEIRKVFKFFKE